MDMGTDSLTAVGPGVEQPDPQGMRLPPRLQDERLLNLPLALRAHLFLGVIEAAAVMALLVRAGWTRQPCHRLQVRGPWRCGGFPMIPSEGCGPWKEEAHIQRGAVSSELREMTELLERRDIRGEVCGV